MIGPGRRASRWISLLARLSHPADRDWIVADAQDEYHRRRDADGEPAADRWIRSQALRAIGPGLSERWRRRGRVGHGGSASPGLLLRFTDDLKRDTWHAARSLARSPGLSGLVVGSLAVGIAGTAVVFSIGQSVLFPGPGPISDPTELVTLYESAPNGEQWRQVSFPNFEDIQRSVPALTDVSAARIGVVRIGEDDGAKRVMVELVTGNYFDLMGIRPAIGRTFSPEESRMGSAAPLVVLSHDLWQTRYAGSPGVIGQMVRVDGRPHTVIGVAPPRLTSRLMQIRVDAWIPLGIPGGTYHANEAELTNRADQEYHVMGRLAAGTDMARVESQLATLGVELAELYPEAWLDHQGQPRGFSVAAEKDSRIPPDFRLAGTLLLALLLAGAGLLLAIACFNVAGLLLARAERRSSEMNVRVSIGASRGRIIRMLLTESLLLSSMGCLAGVGLTLFFIGRASGIPLPGTLPDLSFDLRVDLPVLLFALAVATTASVIFGLAPALQASRADGGSSQNARGGRKRGRGRRRLVIAQIAGSAVFLVGAGLMQRTASLTEGRDSGLTLASAALVNWEVGSEGSSNADWIPDLTARFLAEGEVDQVELATAAEATPFWNLTSALLRLPGFEETVTVAYNGVTPGYADMSGLDLLQGRWLNDADRAGSLESVVVNQRFASLYFPDGDAIGRSFTIQGRISISTPVPGPEVTVQIVGIAENVANTADGLLHPYFWAALDQFPSASVVVHARGQAGPGAVAAGLARVTGDRTADRALVSCRAGRDRTDRSSGRGPIDAVGCDLCPAPGRHRAGWTALVQRRPAHAGALDAPRAGCQLTGSAPRGPGRRRQSRRVGRFDRNADCDPAGHSEPEPAVWGQPDRCDHPGGHRDRASECRPAVRPARRDARDAGGPGPVPAPRLVD